MRLLIALVKLISSETAVRCLFCLGIVRCGIDRVCSRVVYRIAFNHDTFLHFELTVSVLTIIQAMKSGGLYKSYYRFSIELILNFHDEWESYTTLLPISPYNKVTRKENREKMQTIP
jgi:hypothetical protein